MIRLYTAALLLLFAGCAAGATRDDIWLYLGFDGAAEHVQPTYGFVVERSGRDEPLIQGRVGDALLLHPGHVASVQVLAGASPFPVAEGSVVLWVRPERALDGNSRWLMMGGWASFDLHLGGDQILAYATGNPRHFLKGSLAGQRQSWANQWHLVVMTWKGPVRELYVDGRLLARRADAVPVAAAPGRIDLGFLRSSRERPEGAYLEGALDEFAVLRTALGSEEVAELYQSGVKPGNGGILAQVGAGVSLWMDRHAWVRGEKARVAVAPYASGDRLSLWAQPLDGESQGPLRLTEAPIRARELELDTAALRPGRYRVQAVVNKGPERVGVSLESEIRVVAHRSADFPVGLDALPLYPDRVLDEARRWGISFTSLGGYRRETIASDLDRLLLHGLSFMPGLNIHHQKSMVLPKSGYFDDAGVGTPKLGDEVLQSLVLHGDDTYARHSASLGSPFSPTAREGMRERLREMLRAAGGHPGLYGVAFDDEYTFRIGTDQASGKHFYGDYSTWARDHFRQATGLEAPFPPVAPPGTVWPDDHPYLRWRDLVGMPGDPTTAGLAMSWANLSQLVHEMRPDVLTTTYSGGEYGELDAIMDYGYPAIWEPRPHLLVGHGRLDFLFDRHRARQRVTPERPVWALTGWWSHDLREQPDWCVADLRLSTALSLAKGAKLVHWFTTWPKPKDPTQPGGGLLSREDLRGEMIRWAGWLREQGPMYARLSVESQAHVAVLLSEDDRAGKVYRENQPLQLSWMYAAIRLAGYPVDLVTDEQVKAGALDRYDALVLANFDYASQSLWQRLQAFAGTPGKTVFVDRTTELRPGAVVELPFQYGQRGDPHTRYDHEPMPPTGYLAWMAQQLRTVLPIHLGPATSGVQGSDYVAPFSLAAGTGKLMTLINYHLSDPQAVQVSLPTADAPVYVYDADAGSLVGQSSGPGQPLIWQARVPAAGAARFLLLPRPIHGVNASVTQEGGEFVVRAAVTDEGGQPIAFPFPLRVNLIDPAGHQVAAYERYTAADSATGTLEWRLPKATLMDPVGNWDVNVRELISGRESRLRSATVAVE